jgi:hypothetical protein
VKPSRRKWLAPALALLCVAWAGLAPIHMPSRESVFEIPHGTYARRRAGDLVDILPSRIRLTLGLDDVLLVRNRDEVPQQFGPTILMPGQSLRLPFEVASENQFECSAHTSGQLTVVVEPEPVWPWQKIRWRVRHWLEREQGK